MMAIGIVLEEQDTTVSINIQFAKSNETLLEMEANNQLLNAIKQITDKLEKGIYVSLSKENEKLFKTILNDIGNI